MTSQVNTTVRLVRCPGCRKLLQESADIPVYECGGCGKRLQAKIRRRGAESTGSLKLETYSTQESEMDRVSKVGRISSLNQEAANLSNEMDLASEGGAATSPDQQTIIHSPTESAPRKSSEKDQHEVRDCEKEHLMGVNLSDELPGSNELACHENGESSPQSGAATCPNQETIIHSPTESALRKSSERDQHEIRDCEKEYIIGVNLSDELSSSNELACHENGEPSPQSRADMEAHEDKSYLDQHTTSDQNETGGSYKEQFQDTNFHNNLSSSTELENDENEPISQQSGASTEVGECSVEQSSGKDGKACGDCCGELPAYIKISAEVSSSTEHTCHEIEEPSDVAGADNEVDESLKSRFIFRSSGTENVLDTSPRDSFTTAQRPLDEGLLSDKLTSPIKEQKKQAQEMKLQGFDRVSSVDTLEDMPIVDPSSLLCASLGEKPTYPTTRSYYGYDGSVSSCYETDDQVPDRRFQRLKRNFKDADFVSPRGLAKREGLMASNSTSSDLGKQHQAANHSSILSGRKYNVTNGSKLHRDGFSGPTAGRGHPIRRLEKDENLSRPPFYPRGSRVGQKTGSPSGYGHNDFEYSSSNYSSEYPESDRMELLRMVYELQDKLSRTCVSKVNGNGRFPPRVPKQERQNSSYYDHLASEREVYPDSKYGRCNQRKRWSQPCIEPRTAFSGEARHCRHQVDCSCLHCCPQEWHCSAQLPPRVVCCNQGHYTTHHNHSCYNPTYRSGPSSPQHYTGSEFTVRTRDTKSDDQQLKNREIKRPHRREKHHMMKRHFLPIAGGAPIVACYRCSELLQLPVDFLPFGQRRCHRLRCSACSEVLKFSHRNKSSIVPYVPDEAIAPPPSEVDDYNDAQKKRHRAPGDCPHAEPMSCSDDYGQSFCKSCSTEGDPFSLTPPFHTLQKDSHDRKMSSGSSLEPVEERKGFLMKEGQNKYKNPVDSAGSLSKMSRRKKFSSEIEEPPARAGSPLHRLMGYESPSTVING